ncbi:MAG: hypothetical protein CM15mP49_26180 [Actinomycetota bacterium]|nr:MAG: hypothetical protein CM15mP49_26180 [Actinomycetota bacterium]
MFFKPPLILTDDNKKIQNLYWYRYSHPQGSVPRTPTARPCPNTIPLFLHELTCIAFGITLFPSSTSGVFSKGVPLGLASGSLRRFYFTDNFHFFLLKLDSFRNPPSTIRFVPDTQLAAGFGK